ncbi:MAG: Ig-like domain-containing protein, partial [Candidatus Poribacteria bacterium]|nr:Ig-like domain-containing protein [Candidatus Poribacteria bacterium]
MKQISATSVGNRLDLKFTTTPSFGTKNGIFRIDLSFFVLPTATDLATGEITIKDISLMLSKTKRQLDKIKILSSGSFTVLADIKLELDGLSLAPSQSGVIGLKLRKPDFQISKGQILIQTVPNIKILAFDLNKVLAKTMTVAKIDNGILLKVNQNPPNAEQVGTIEIEIPKTLDPKIKNEIKIEAEMYANEESKYGIVLQLGKIQIMDKIAPIGSFVINKTDIYTTDQMVILNTVATDVGFGVESMRFKNDEDFSQSDQKIKWIKFSPTVTNSASSEWNLSDEEGIKTVFCQFQDFSGNIITSSLSDQIIFDQTAPIGSISIVGDRTRQAGITIKLVASDELSNMKEVGEVRLRNEEEDFSDTDWKPFSDQIEWKVPSGEGIRTVFAEFRDGAGNVSEVASDSVEFDDLAPEVVSFNPDGTEDFVQVDTIISVEFSEEVQIDEQYLIVSSDKVDRIWGEIRTNTNRVTFVAEEIFKDVEKISVIIKSGIPDLIGNPVAEEVSWSFTTGVGVFPGDTNKDGEVNAADIIPIGRFWREKGEPRQESTTNWVLQTAKPFKMQPATVADADGNGIVDADDIVPVALNWMKKTSEPRTVAEGS